LKKKIPETEKNTFVKFSIFKTLSLGETQNIKQEREKKKDEILR